MRPGRRFRPALLEPLRAFAWRSLDGAVVSTTPGEGHRDFGELRVSWRIASTGLKVDVTLTLAGGLVGVKTLLPATPVYDFGQVSNNGWDAAGLVGATFMPPDQLSTLSGRFTYGPQGAQPERFQGVITYWTATQDVRRVEPSPLPGAEPC